MAENQRCRFVNNRSPRARALGKALREARVDRGIGLREFAKSIDRDPSLLSRWETGDRTPPPTEVARILGNLHITGERYDQTMELSHGADDPLWLATTLPEQKAQLAALIDFEQNASIITDVSPLLVPGLLQTRQYARAIMSAGWTVPPKEVDVRVGIRMDRQAVLTREDPVRVRAYIGEAALRQRLGSRAIMAAQLRHLAAMSGRENVEIRIVPFESDWHPGLEGPSLLIESETEPPIAHLEVRGTGIFLHSRSDLAACRQAAARLSEQAMSIEDSVTLLALITARWESA
jgi:transcriptional regulator with XRE-family HTH domain